LTVARAKPNVGGVRSELEARKVEPQLLHAAIARRVVDDQHLGAQAESSAFQTRWAPIQEARGVVAHEDDRDVGEFALAVGPALAGDHAVKGYVKKDGTYVAPTTATDPNATKLDSYSTKGNVNPYNGKAGNVDPYAFKPSKPLK